MSILRPDEIEAIAKTLREPPACAARAWSEKIVLGTATAADLLDIQLFLARSSSLCSEVQVLQRLYDDLRIRTAQRSAARRDPTIQETNRKKQRKGKKP